MNDLVDWRGELLLELIDAAKRGQKEILESGELIESFDRGRDAEIATNADPEKYFRARVYKTQQYKREIKPRLYNPQGTMRFGTMVADNIDFNYAPGRYLQAKRRGEAAEEYLNYCVNQVPFDDNVQEAVYDSFVSYGCVWHGIDPVNPRVATAEHDSWKNTLLDPDATKLRDCNYIIRQRRGPKWKLAQRYKKAASIINDLPTMKRPTNHVVRGDPFCQEVEYYEVYMKVGLHNYKQDHSLYAKVKGFKDVPRKYVVSERGDLLWHGDWETPFYLDGSWPVSILGYYPSTDTPYPVSPLFTGLPIQRAINWAVTTFLARFRWTNRQILVFLRSKLGGQLTPESEQAILYGDDPVVVADLIASAAQMSDPEGADVSKYVQQIYLGGDEGKGLQVIDWLEQKFAEETGLNEIFLSGQPDKQDRSAAATRLRQAAITSRINDMRGKFDRWLREVGKKIFLTLAYHMDPADAEVAIGRELATYWGRVTDDIKPREYWLEKVKGQIVDKGGEESISYFSEQALEQAADQMLTESVTLEEWAQETDITVDGAVVRQKTPEEREAAKEQLANQYPAFLGEMGAPLAGMRVLAERMRDIGADPEIVQEVVRQGEAMQRSVDARHALEQEEIRARIEQIRAQTQQIAQQAQMGQQQQQQQEQLDTMKQLQQMQ